MRLNPASVKLEEAKVTAVRRSNTEMSMISSIKASNLVVNGISAQQIARTQDKDAGEIIKRVPGITIIDDPFVVVRRLVERYNMVTLNGTTASSSEADKRAFSFDVISSNLIDNILIYKTPAPELPADFAGAVINIITKNDIDKTGITVSYSTGFNENTTFQNFTSYHGGKFDWLGFDDGTRKLPSIMPSAGEMKNLRDFFSNVDTKKQELTEISKAFDNSGFKNRTIKVIPDQSLNITANSRFVAGKATVANITSVLWIENS